MSERAKVVGERTVDTVLDVVTAVAERITPLAARVPGLPQATAMYIHLEQVSRGLLHRQQQALAESQGWVTRTEVERLREQLDALAVEVAPERASRSRRHRPPIHWREGGEGPPVLLINGWAMSGIVWPGEFLQTLEASHRVLRPDNRGTGWSQTAPLPFTIADLADDAATVLRSARVAMATVVGISMGGMIAQELALRHPELVDHLVLVSTQLPRPAEVAAGPGLLGPSLRAPGDGSTGAWFHELWSNYCAPGFAEGHPDRMAELVDQILRRPTPRRVLFEQMRAMAAWGRPGRASAIAVPTTVVHGDEDPLVPVANGMRVAQAIPGARYVELEGVGHMPQMEAPERLAEVVHGVAVAGTS